MERKMETTLLGYIGIIIRTFPSFISKEIKDGRD